VIKLIWDIDRVVAVVDTSRSSLLCHFSELIG